MGEMDQEGPASVAVPDDPRIPLRTWGICGLMLLATMLNYMDRQARAQQATEIRAELKLNNKDYGRLESGFGLAFAIGGLLTGTIAHRAQLRWVLPPPPLARSAG